MADRSTKEIPIHKRDGFKTDFFRASGRAGAGVGTAAEPLGVVLRHPAACHRLGEKEGCPQIDRHEAVEALEERRAGLVAGASGA